MPERTPNNYFNKKQFEQLFKTHFGYLCNFAQQYVGEAAIAQDICQNVFITLWEKRSQIDSDQSIKSYLFTAVKNRCLNYIRDHKKYRSKILDIDCGDLDLDTENYHEAKGEPFSAEELQGKISQALGTLPPKCRQVFEMSRFREMKYREIAEELGIAQKTVEAHMTKAMKCLKENLKDYLTVLISIFWWLQ